MPVLFYCTEAMMAYIKDSGQAFLCADETGSDAALRNLDERVDDCYTLVVATTPEAMRGVDYRAKTIALLVGKSFANAREADQGLKRVGRRSDKGWRIAIEGIPLIDPTQEALYQTKLLSFCRQISSAKTMCKSLGAIKAPEKEKKLVVTRGSKKTKEIVDTTAKSTPAGLTGKQEQTAAFFKQLAQAPVLTIPAKEEVKAIADCLILEQD